MEPIAFAEANQTFTAPPGMDDCGDLPVQNDGTQLLSCWQMSWRERLAALFFGRVWLCIAGQQQPPVWLRCEKDCQEEPNAEEAD